MTGKLPDELQSVVNAHPGELLELVDEQTKIAYVLVPADQYRRLQTIAGEELAETYVAQVETAMAAGWGELRMDDYDDYDAHRGQP